MEGGCPFCGEEINLQVCQLDLELGYAVFCFTCVAAGPQKDTPLGALEAWRGRADDDLTPRPQLTLS